MEPVKLAFAPGSDAELRLKRFLRDKIQSTRDGLKDLYERKLGVWRDAYEAKPAEKERDFPWHGASNLVVPLIGIHSDTLLARVMSAVIKTRPLWVSGLIGAIDEAPENLKSDLEEFLQYVGLEPDELDLYRVYHEWFGETIQLGTSVLKSPWIKRIEDVMGPAGDLSGGRELSRRTIYEGPRPEKLSFENFGIPTAARTIETANFKFDRIKCQRFDLEEKAYLRLYERVAVQEVLKQADRSSPDSVQVEREQGSGTATIPGYGFAEYDLYECHFRYRLEGDKFCRVIATFHPKSNQLLRAYHFYYPDEIYTAARLFYRDDMFHGYGFAEILSDLQEEVSEIHNQRRDNMTVANMKMFRGDPESKVHEGFRTFPSAILPARKDELEVLEFGTPVQGEIDSERLTLELAEKRSGVSPPMQGSGAGTNSKRGIYTAMGTLSVMQEGNTRTDLNITDIRYAHTKLGRLLCKEYAALGKDSDFHRERIEMFGKKMSNNIRTALDWILSGRAALPIYAASASVNREVEKQNDIMMVQIMKGHYQTIAQMLQAAANPMVPPVIQDYMKRAIKSADLVMKITLKHFGHDDVDRLVPEAHTEQGQPPQGGGGQPQVPGAPGQPQGGGGNPLEQPEGQLQPGVGPMPMMPQGGPPKVM